MMPAKSSPNASSLSMMSKIWSSMSDGMVTVVGGIVGGGVVVDDVGGGMVGGGVVVDDVDGGIVGGGVVMVGKVGKVKSGTVKLGMVMGGTVWAPADDISNPAAVAPVAARTITRRFQTCMSTSRSADESART